MAKDKLCGFCHEFNSVKDLNKSGVKQGLAFKYYVCLREDCFYNCVFSGGTMHRKHKLNYCPECGKKLNVNNDNKDCIKGRKED